MFVRTMFSDENLRVMESADVGYVVAARLKSLPVRTKSRIVEDEDYKAGVMGNEFHWVKEYEHNGRRLIVSYNHRRAQKDAADRKRLVDRLLKKANGKNIRLKDLIPNYGSKKYVTVGEEVVHLNEEKIQSDEKWDGFHGRHNEYQG